MALTHLSLFSGIGGLDLAAEMAGIETIGQCEWADYPTKVLEKHWPDIPRWRDIRTLTRESFHERTGRWTVDIVSGGFPCQPFSLAGKRTGTDDDRYLWPEMLRVIQELQPTWVVGENVVGIINLALDTVLSDLENEGYASQAFVVPACGVDAPHKRERVAILAYSIDRGSTLRRNRELQNSQENGREGSDNRGRETATVPGERWENESGTSRVVNGLRTTVHEINTNPDSFTIQGSGLSEICQWGGVQKQSPRTVGMHSAWEDWPDEPRVDRVVDGIPNRMDRIKCLGNAVVPQQFYPFFAAIVAIEEGDENDK